MTINPEAAICLICIAIPLIYWGIILPFSHRKKWKKDERDRYLTKTAYEFEYKHAERVREWLMSKDAQNTYVEAPKEFFNSFYEKSDEIANQLIQELKQKYVNDYKSRNKESTQSI